MGDLQAIGLGAVRWPEDDLPDRVGEGIQPQAPVQVRAGEQLGVVLRQPGQERWPPQAETALCVEGPDDRDQLQVPWPHPGELEVQQRTDVIAVDHDVAQIEVRVQQDVVAAGRHRVPEFGQAFGCCIQNAVVHKGELPGQRDQRQGRRGRQRHQFRAGPVQRIGIRPGPAQHLGELPGHRPGMQRPQQRGHLPGQIAQPRRLRLHEQMLTSGPRNRGRQRPGQPVISSAGQHRRNREDPAEPVKEHGLAGKPAFGLPAMPPGGSRLPAARRRCCCWEQAERR